jgi:Ca-activated chloride channel homolog
MRFVVFLIGLATASAQFKVDVRLVRLLVNVKNPAGDLVGSIDRNEFTVYDSGIPQQIAVFERYTTQPLSVVVMIDNSLSTAKDRPYELTSIGKFMSALIREGNERDAAALYTFNYEVTLLNSFTRNYKRFEDSMKLIRNGSGTSLYDAIYFGARELQGREGRRVMVIVTDGGDTTSAKKYKDAVNAAQRAEAIFYPIVVVPITNDAGRNLGGEHALETLADATGGRWFYPDVGRRLDDAFSEILRDLRSQYMVGYYPRDLPKDTPNFHTVRVEMKRKDLRAFTRTGYYGESR